MMLRSALGSLRHARWARESPRCRGYSTDITKPFRDVKKGVSWLVPKEMLNPNRPPATVDVLIVGGGIMGSSTAYFLRRLAKYDISVAVIEKDATYAKASTVLSAGGIRQQFSMPENIHLSMHSAQFMKTIKETLSVEGMDPPDVQFNDQGYLFLASKEQEHILYENHITQKNHGARVELLTQDKLKERFPWLNTDGISLASYGLENEGWFDPWSLLTAFRSKAIDLGAGYYNAEVTGFGIVDGEGEPIDPTEFSPSGRKVNSVEVSMLNSPEKITINASHVVLTAGAWSGEMGKLLGIGTGPKDEGLHVPIPVSPRKRYVYVVHCPDGPGIDCPLVIDQSGFYIRREGFGGNYIAGRSPDEDNEPSCRDLNVDYDFFDEEIWPFLAHRVPAMEKLKVKNAWAGYYDYNTLDQNAIIGRHTTYGNLLMATGFSGHGIQQSPAIGQILSELILTGQSQTIDVTRFGFGRCLTNTPILEKCIV